MIYCNVRLNNPRCQRTTGAKCFACGDSACLKCSSRIVWYCRGRRRVCNDCKLKKIHARINGRWTARARY